MISDTFVTKLILQHILYPTGVNSYELLDQNVNQQTSGTNYFPYIVPNTKNNLVYGVKPRINVPAYGPGQNGESNSSIDLMYHEEYPLKNIM
jgi:hypothetical protein